MPISALIVRLWRVALLVAVAALLAACQETSVPKHMRPLPAKLTAKMAKLNMDPRAPVYIRSYKETSEFEVWKQRRDGRYGLLSTYQICKWSGKLGPKIKEGDRQAPEGFYTILPSQMNPNSSYFLSFNIGFPNAYDRAWGRSGTNLMVHGACSSAGCYSMTDEAAGEIYWLARDAFIGGQRSFQVNLYPFRMTPDNFARHRDDPNIPFWMMLKEGSDHFAVTGRPPVIGVCDKRYVFDADPRVALNATAPCPDLNQPPALMAAVKAKQDTDNQMIAMLSAKYEAGGQQIAAQPLSSQGVDDATRAAGRAAQEAQAATIASIPAPGAVAPVAAVTPDDTAPLALQAPPVPQASPMLKPAAPMSVPEGVNPAADAASLAIGGVPAPEMPLPVPSPLRATVITPVIQPQPPAPVEQPGFWGKMKKKLALPG